MSGMVFEPDADDDDSVALGCAFGHESYSAPSAVTGPSPPRQAGHQGPDAGRRCDAQLVAKKALVHAKLADGLVGVALGEVCFDDDSMGALSERRGSRGRECGLDRATIAPA